MSKMDAFKLILKQGIYRSPLHLMGRVNILAAGDWNKMQMATEETA